MAKKEKVLEHTSALQQNRTDPDMKVKPTLIIHRIICYILLNPGFVLLLHPAC